MSFCAFCVQHFFHKNIKFCALLCRLRDKYVLMFFCQEFLRSKFCEISVLSACNDYRHASRSLYENFTRFAWSFPIVYIFIYFSVLGGIMLIKIVTFAMFIVPYSDLSSLVNCLRSWILGEMVRNAPRRLCV